MRMMRRAPLLLVLLLSLTVPAQALGVVLAPPGKSGADQYFETVPTAGGNAAPPQSGTSFSGRGTGTSALNRLGHGRAGATGLARLGKTGQAAAALAAGTAPAPASGSGAAGTGRGGSRSGQIQSLSIPPGQSTASALGRLLGGSDLGGLGFLLPLLLVTALVAALAAGIVMLLSRRGRPPDAAA